MSLRRKRLAKEATETAPNYMCTEVSMKDVPDYAKLFSAVEHLGHADGVVDTKRMDDRSITTALRLLEKKFASRGVSCAACYADYLVRDAVNVGVYFNSPDEEASFAREFQGELRVLSQAVYDQSRGEYRQTYTTTPQFGEQYYPGHNKKTPHYTM